MINQTSIKLYKYYNLYFIYSLGLLNIPESKLLYYLNISDR